MAFRKPPQPKKAKPSAAAVKRPTEYRKMVKAGMPPAKARKIANR